MTRQQKLHQRAGAKLRALEEIVDKLKAAGPCDLDGVNALRNVRDRLTGLAGRCDCHWLGAADGD